MSNPEFTKIHEALQLISDRVQAYKAPLGGICSAFSDIFDYEFHLDSDEPFDQLYHWFGDWPKRSGNASFPVPSPCGKPIAAFYRCFEDKTMWAGEYGDNRKELLAYLLKRAHFAAYVN